jgi:hypothetical protein
MIGAPINGLSGTQLAICATKEEENMARAASISYQDFLSVWKIAIQASVCSKLPA